MWMALVRLFQLLLRSPRCPVRSLVYLCFDHYRWRRYGPGRFDYVGQSGGRWIQYGFLMPVTAFSAAGLQAQRIVLALDELRRERQESQPRLKLDRGIVRAGNLERCQETGKVAHGRQILESQEFQ